MTKDEALQLALKAMEVEQTVYLRTKLPVPEYLIKAITAIKEALEIKDEPVAYQDIKEKCKIEVVPAKGGLLREWVGLTDEERRDIREWQMIQEELGPIWAPTLFYFYLAIEAKLKERNT
jgi:hypothetical protein